jgi:hypothetical protein
MLKHIGTSKAVLFWITTFAAVNAGAWLLFTRLPTSPFLDSFFGNEIATLVGLLLGVPIALGLSRRQQAAGATLHENQARLANLRRELPLLNQLDLCLSTNLIFLDRARNMVSPGQPLWMRPDSMQLDTTAALKYEAIPDISLAALIDVVRFDLSHISRLMDLHSQITYGDYRTTVSPQRYEFEGRMLADQIREFCNNATTNINDVIPRMRARIEEIRTQL